ncbi:MAG: hypothetical protein AAFO29_03735 [Actinomycetota bacterium]
MQPTQPSTVVDPGPLQVWPRSKERPADAGWTLVGGIDDPAPARVDRGGLLSPEDAAWTMDWWIGADDRWYLPSREASVRQRRDGPGPIVETSMRVPSGDVVATAYPVVVGARRATVFEVRNDSPVPVVLAIAVRPVALDGSAGDERRIGFTTDGDTTAMTVDGHPAVLLPRSPNERVADSEADVFTRVEAGDALVWGGPVTGRWANAACLYPLPHTTSLRVVIPSDDQDGPVAFDGLPPAETVASGWASIVDRAATFGFPDPGLTELVGAARARLVLGAVDLPDRLEVIDRAAAATLEALAIGGHADECLPALERLAEMFPRKLPSGTNAEAGPKAGAALLRAAAAAAELYPPTVAESLLASMAQVTSLVERKGDPVTGARAKLALARLVDRAGQPDAARHLRDAAAPVMGRVAAAPTIDLTEPDSSAGLEGDPRADAALDAITALAQEASPAGSWSPDDDVRAAARFVTLSRDLVVASGDTEPTADGDQRRTIDLLLGMPSAWLGGQIEVHRAPVAGVRVSYAIRWHGYRPALLWEVHDDHDVGIPVLRCPGLDHEWSTDQASGETLLSGSPVELPDVPAPGDSFQ